MSLNSAVEWSPENPFVRNPDFFQNRSHVVYSQTGVYLFFRINFIFSSIFGLLGVAYVVWLVVYRTPTHFKPYSKMLLLCAGSDVYVILGDFLCQTRLKVTSSYMIATLSGPASRLPYNMQCYMLGWQASAVVLASCCLPVQYYIRYYTIKNSQAPSSYRIFFLFALACLAAFISVLTTHHSFSTFDNSQSIEFERYWYNEVPVPQLFIGSQNYSHFIYHICFMCSAMIVGYSLCILLSKMTIREMEKRTSHLTIKTRSLQEQFARMLFAQSLCPLLTTIIPVLCAVIAMILNTNSQNLGDFIVASVTWFPFLNACSNVIIIVPYRQHLLSVLTPCYSKGRRRGQSSVMPAHSAPSFAQRSITPAINTVAL